MAAIGPARAQELIDFGRSVGLTDEQIAQLAREPNIDDIRYISGRRADELWSAIRQERDRAEQITEALRLAVLGGHDPEAIRPRLAQMGTEAIRDLVARTEQYLRRRGVDTRTDEQRAADRARAQSPATERQVQYILTLLRRRTRSGDGGGFYSGPTDEAGIRGLSREEASIYIDSLRETY